MMNYPTEAPHPSHLENFSLTWMMLSVGSFLSEMTRKHDDARALALCRSIREF
jgi:hypothetical protein